MDRVPNHSPTKVISCRPCLSALCLLSRLDCNHFFHASCLRRYLNSCKDELDLLCPVCRAKIACDPPGGRKPTRTRATVGPVVGRNMVRDAVVPTTDVQPNHALGSVLRGNSRTPDSLSRAARGADATLRLGRQFAQVLLGEGLHGTRPRANAGVPDVARPDRGILPGAISARGDGSDRPARPAYELSSPSANRSGMLSYGWRLGRGYYGARSGEGGIEDSTISLTEIGAISDRLLEIFPDMSRQSALLSARMARGSLERAVNIALESTSSEAGESGSVPGSHARAASGSGAVDVSGGRSGFPHGVLRRRW